MRTSTLDGACSDGDDGFVESVGGAGEKVDIDSGMGKSGRNRCVNATARAGDQCGLAHKSSRHA